MSLQSFGAKVCVECHCFVIILVFKELLGSVFQAVEGQKVKYLLEVYGPKEDDTFTCQWYSWMKFLISCDKAVLILNMKELFDKKFINKARNCWHIMLNESILCS